MRYPIYVVSKGRAHQPITARALAKMGVPFKMVVEESEHEDYAKLGYPLLTLDPAYQRDYDTCDDLGDDLSKGPGPARNFAWQHALDEGHQRHWVMDDNLRSFRYFHGNQKHWDADGTLLASCEDFTDRYENVGMSGPAYEHMIRRKERYLTPFSINTRIYSCNLILNSLPHRWRGRYNEDTILSIDLLTNGWCTIQFLHSLADKVATQKMEGGNTDEFYAHEGTARKSELLKAVYPQYVKLVKRYNRPHHFVNYKRHWSRTPRLKRRSDDISDFTRGYELVSGPRTG